MKCPQVCDFQVPAEVPEESGTSATMLHGASGSREAPGRARVALDLVCHVGDINVEDLGHVESRIRTIVNAKNNYAPPEFAKETMSFRTSHHAAVDDVIELSFKLDVPGLTSSIFSLFQ